MQRITMKKMQDVTGGGVDWDRPYWGVNARRIGNFRVTSCHHHINGIVFCDEDSRCPRCGND